MLQRPILPTYDNLWTKNIHQNKIENNKILK